MEPVDDKNGIDDGRKVYPKRLADGGSKPRPRHRAEEDIRSELNRLDDVFARLHVFEEFVATSLLIGDAQSFIQHSLKTVIETHEMEKAAFFVAKPVGQLRLAGGLGLDGIDDGLVVDLACLPKDRSGFLSKTNSSGSLADALGIYEGMFCRYKAKRAQLGGYLVTGNSETGVGAYQSPSDDHLALFATLCAQIGGLWTNHFF